MGDPRSPGRHSRGQGRRGQLHWMMGLGSTVAALAAVVAMLVVHSAPAVSLPSSFQIGPTPIATHVSTTLAPSLTGPRTTPTTRVVIVTPQEPVTDSNDLAGSTSKDGESSSTRASQN
jgi:hypothetical protein